MSQDLSIIGLLLKAHGDVAAQAHGEEYVFHNTSASNHFEQAKGHIEAAIKSVGFAQNYVARADALKEKK